MKKTLEILVVEDNSKHLEDARSVIDSANYEGISISAKYAINKDEASKMMAERKYDGVISDVFIPSIKDRTTESDADEVYNLVKSGDNYKKMLEPWKNGEELAPLGVLVAEECLKAETPVILCTDTYHHGKKTAPVHGYSMLKNVGMVDVYEAEEGHVSKKKWDVALGTLLGTIELYEHKKSHAEKPDYELRDSLFEKLSDKYKVCRSGFYMPLNLLYGNN